MEKYRNIERRKRGKKKQIEGERERKSPLHMGKYQNIEKRIRERMKQGKRKKQRDADREREFLTFTEI